VPGAVPPVTLVTYDRDVRRLTAVLGDVPLRNLTPGLVQSAYAALLDQGFSRELWVSRRWLETSLVFTNQNGEAVGTTPASF